LRDSDDQLDVLIRCAVRERAAGAAPPRGAWERILCTIARSSGLWQVWSRLGTRVEAIGMYLAGEDSGLPGLGDPVWYLGDGAPRAHDLHWTRLNRHQVIRLVA
jgi:hypothetical protein